MISPEDMAAIKRWAQQEEQKPWPLDSTQLDLIRRALGRRERDGAARGRQGGQKSA